MSRSLLLACFLSTAAFGADDRFVPRWESTCHIAQNIVKISASSQSGDPTEDDMKLMMSWSGEDPQDIHLKPSLFVTGQLASNVDSACDKLTGVQLKPGKLLVLIRRDDRPSEDRLAAVLLDLKSKRVLHLADDLGALSKRSKVKRDASGVHLLIAPPIANRADEKEPVLQWLQISSHADRLQMQWATKNDLQPKLPGATELKP